MRFFLHFVYFHEEKIYQILDTIIKYFFAYAYEKTKSFHEKNTFLKMYLFSINAYYKFIYFESFQHDESEIIYFEVKKNQVKKLKFFGINN